MPWQDEREPDRRDQRRELRLVAQRLVADPLDRHVDRPCRRASRARARPRSRRRVSRSDDVDVAAVPSGIAITPKSSGIWNDPSIDDRLRLERPEHEVVAVGEVDQLDDPVDERVAERDERVDHPVREPDHASPRRSALGDVDRLADQPVADAEARGARRRPTAARSTPAGACRPRRLADCWIRGWPWSRTERGPRARPPLLRPASRRRPLPPCGTPSRRPWPMKIDSVPSLGSPFSSNEIGPTIAVGDVRLEQLRGDVLTRAVRARDRVEQRPVPPLPRRSCRPGSTRPGLGSENVVENSSPAPGQLVRRRSRARCRTCPPRSPARPPRTASTARSRPSPSASRSRCRRATATLSLTSWPPLFVEMPPRKMPSAPVALILRHQGRVVLGRPCPSPRGRRPRGRSPSP